MSDKKTDTETEPTQPSRRPFNGDKHDGGAIIERPPVEQPKQPKQIENDKTDPSTRGSR